MGGSGGKKTPQKKSKRVDTEGEDKEYKSKIKIFSAFRDENKVPIILPQGITQEDLDELMVTYDGKMEIGMGRPPLHSFSLFDKELPEDFRGTTIMAYDDTGEEILNYIKQRIKEIKQSTNQ